MTLPNPGFITSTFSNRYKVYVTWVDHGSYVKDQNQQPALSSVSHESGKNFHIAGFRLDGAGDPFKQAVVIPQEVQGSFKLPRIGDVIVVEENYREPNKPPVYVYSIYNDLPLSNYASSPIPRWGNIPNDYGHLRSHRDHNSQFSPKGKSSFTQKYIKSVTGYRFRSNYLNVHGTSQKFLDKGKFVVRGDSVFDVQKNSALMSQIEINTEYGMDIIPSSSNSLSSDKADYPNPLNVPTFRNLDDAYIYSEQIPVILDKPIETDYYAGRGSNVNRAKVKSFQTKMRVKNYLSYQPVVDARYYEYLLNASPDAQGNKADPVERELPAAEEYQVALRGNNKLLIQDQYGDGEQLLITLKNQYDSGFTVVHNSENSQIRVRDHLGQGVLIEGNPESPRVISWTTERQFIDMGSVRSFDSETGSTETKGEYLYLRNGSVYGKSDTSFGRLLDEVPRDGVSQQELAMINAPDAAGLSELMENLSSRMSSGISSFINSNPGTGLYFRNNFDPNETNQHFGIFSDFSTQPVLTTKMYQEHTSPLNSKTIKSELTQTVQDSESRTYMNNYYQESGITTNNTVVRKSNSGTSENEYSLIGIFSGVTSTFSKKEFVLPDSSNITESNIVTDLSEYTKTRSATSSGLISETSTYKDLIKNNSVENYIDTSPNTRITQKIDGDKTNQLEMTSNAVITTQYVENLPYTEVNQTASSINLNRKVAGLAINIGAVSGDDLGGGSITIGSPTSGSGDTIVINGATVDINQV